MFLSKNKGKRFTVQQYWLLFTLLQCVISCYGVTIYRCDKTFDVITA